MLSRSCEFPCSLDPHGAHGVENGQDSHTHIGKDSDPHPGTAQDTQGIWRVVEGTVNN